MEQISNSFLEKNGQFSDMFFGVIYKSYNVNILSQLSPEIVSNITTKYNSYVQNILNNTTIRTLYDNINNNLTINNDYDITYNVNQSNNDKNINNLLCYNNISLIENTIDSIDILAIDTDNLALNIQELYVEILTFLQTNNIEVLPNSLYIDNDNNLFFGNYIQSGFVSGLNIIGNILMGISYQLNNVLDIGNTIDGLLIYIIRAMIYQQFVLLYINKLNSLENIVKPSYAKFNTFVYLESVDYTPFFLQKHYNRVLSQLCSILMKNFIILF